ncbi:hypothetical protein [Hydrogenimonas urashimensis]|uniref:hypothetical protein n=1 Tax=Hydrogenimonas urashimensis TaxID=2740515 RepID=UPI0019164D1E|nr:hypothetical protein [Hydrogenimonas urashimensis]
MDESLTEARKRFEAIAQGRYVPKKLSVGEAKKRLRETDPGIDVSDLLCALAEGDLKRAGSSFLWQTLAPETVAYFTPLIVGAIASMMETKPEKKGENS